VRAFASDSRGNAAYVASVALGSILVFGLLLSFLQPIWTEVTTRTETQAEGTRYAGDATTGLGYLEDLMAGSPWWILLVVVVFVLATTAYLSARRA
jgi:hypothetical protein